LRTGGTVIRYWTTYWQNRFWRADVNPELAPFDLSGSNQYSQRGVSAGDTVFVVSVKKGQLHLGGRMIVREIVSHEVAAALAGSDELFDASEWIVARDGTGSPLALGRRLEPAATRRLRFRSSSGVRGLKFKSHSNLDEQTLRGVRELSPESARILDWIVEATDRHYQVGATLIVTERELEGADSRMHRSV
jgi:hypothetical protein